MSTYLHLECQDHTPPLLSDGEVGQHLYDLPRIRSEIARRESFAELEDCANYDHHFTRNAARFLALHRHCRITIRDEYGVEHPVTDET